MNTTTVLFFGSTTDSVIILEKLATLKAFSIAAVVTQPAKSVGRDHVVTPTPVGVWAEEHHHTVLTFESNPEKPWVYANEQQVIDALQPVQADLLVSASYGIKIPWSTIADATFGGINIHPSILPHWRGADPVPWAILSGDHQIGVSVVTLSETFDQGVILAQKKIPITPKDTSDPLRTKLFGIGAELLPSVLLDFTRGKLPQKIHRSPDVRSHSTPGVKETTDMYARKFTREDGLESWDVINAAITTGTDAERVERKFRALHPWPGVWTLLRPAQPDYGGLTTANDKRLKILALHLDNGKLVLDQVQLEGKKPVLYNQFSEAYAIIK